MKKVLLLCLILYAGGILCAQGYTNWPADKPETEFIAQAQNRQLRLNGLLLPQEIAMQDKMRDVLMTMMQAASQQTGWDMLELSEYTNNNPLQSGSTPYALRSPRGIWITFQFVADKKALQNWKTYESSYQKKHLAQQQNSNENIQTATQRPLYQHYHDSANHYMQLCTEYVSGHQNEGAALYTKDRHLKYYQQKENEFINKMTGITNSTHDQAGVEQAEQAHERKTTQFRSNAMLQVQFHVNDYIGIPIDQAQGSYTATSIVYPVAGSKVARLYTLAENQENADTYKWKNVLLVLLGNFHTTANEYGFDAAFNHTGQGDEQTPKKIKSDRVQNISIVIRGDKTSLERMLKYIDINKLKGTIVNFKQAL